jgi:inner membrane protein
MDSLTQATLGAAVGVAVMGRRRPVWQAALTGAVVGTLPDLDVFIDKGDAVRDMVLHRAETHALFWQLLATPLVAAALALVTRSWADFRLWLVMVLAGFWTHALLDAMTIYGTRIALPFSDHPFGAGSLFIIDPLYTVPLLLGLAVTGLSRARWRLRWNTAGLVVSTLYAGWSLAAQAHVVDRVMASTAAQGMTREQVLVTPTPFNTVLWRVVLVTDDHYAEGFYSLLDPLQDDPPQLRFAQHPRGGELESRTADFTSANMIRDFSKGFYALSDDGERVRITDLRMGQHPHYVFSFAFAEHQSEPLREIVPIRYRARMPVDEGIDWLWRRLNGEDLPPPA